MSLINVFEVMLSSIAIAFIVRELTRRDRPGDEVQGGYGRWTRRDNGDQS